VSGRLASNSQNWLSGRAGCGRGCGETRPTVVLAPARMFPEGGVNVGGRFATAAPSAELLCAVLRDNRRCRGLEPGGRYAAVRPGADEKPVRELTARLNESDACTAAKGEQATAPAQKGNPKGIPCKGLQGALGWWVCQTRKKFYSVVTDRVAGGPSQVRPKTKSKHERWSPFRDRVESGDYVSLWSRLRCFRSPVGRVSLTSMRGMLVAGSACLPIGAASGFVSVFNDIWDGPLVARCVSRRWRAPVRALARSVRCWAVGMITSPFFSSWNAKSPRLSEGFLRARYSCPISD
jgi:hypothetical protein